MSQPATLADQLLNDKLERVKQLCANNSSDGGANLVDLSQGIVLDIVPHAKFASFPDHDYTPYCQALNKEELMSELGYDIITRLTVML